MKMVPLMLALTLGAALPLPAMAQGAPTAGELASRLAALQQDGSTLIRVKMDVKTGTGESKMVLQLQIKSRRSAGRTDVVYQVLWPKERKGESVLISSTGSGAVYVPPDKIQSLGAAQLKEPLFGSEMAYEDAVENFFAWPDQSLVGTEKVDGVECQILQSKGGKGSSYASVRSWVDVKRMVPLRVEKYSAANQLVRRIDATQVVKVDDRFLPGILAIRRPGQETVTMLDGSRIRRGVSYTEADFTAEGLKNMSPPRGGSE
jgi:outer membrane lipoprotein-sorting protein